MSRARLVIDGVVHRHAKRNGKGTFFPPVPSRGDTNADAFRGKSKRVSGGYVMANYALPYDAPVHLERKTKRPYCAVFHRWVGTDRKDTPKVKPVAKVLFDATPIGLALSKNGSPSLAG